MNVRDRFCSVKPIVPEVSPTKTLTEGMVAREIFFVQLKFSRLARTIIHVVSPVDFWSHLQAMLRIFECFRALNWKLSSFLELVIFFGHVNTILLQYLLNDFAFNETFSFSEVIHRVGDLRVSRHLGRFNVNILILSPILDPWRAVLTVGCFIESIFPNSRKRTVLAIIHKMENYY